MTGARNCHAKTMTVSTHTPSTSTAAQQASTGCTISKVVILLSLGLSACAMHEAPHPSLNADRSQTTIQIDNAIHFSAPDGASVRAAPDAYLVEQTADAQLRLMPDKGGSPLLLAADTGTHDLEVSAPFPLILALNDDARDIILLMPDGTALHARGSLSGVRTRDTVRARRHYHLAYQFDQATGQVQFDNGAIGQRPPTGQSSVLPNYRVGAGASNYSREAASGAEVSMIELQTVLSNRQVALALTVGMMAAQQEPFHLEYNTNRPGNDYGQRTTVSPEACRAICSADGACQAFTFVKPPAGASAGQCYLKQLVPAQIGNPCCISAKRKSTQQELVGNIGR